VETHCTKRIAGRPVTGQVGRAESAGIEGVRVRIEVSDFERQFRVLLESCLNWAFSGTPDIVSALSAQELRRSRPANF
jgi:hypothetical protein